MLHNPLKVLAAKKASPSVIARFGGIAGSSPLIDALSNFDHVWKAVPTSASRYSDGSYAVLYTATREEVALAERIHWAIESVFKKTSQTHLDGFFLYGCVVQGKFRDFTRKWKAEKLFVHPSDYAFCHQVGRKAKLDGYAYIMVPSARRISGRCVPVFERKFASVRPSLGPFRVEWDSTTKLVYKVTASSRRRIAIDRVHDKM